MRLAFVLVLALLPVGTSTRVLVGSVQSLPDPDGCDPYLGVCLRNRIATEHFVVLYDTAGPFGVSDQWARNVSEMAESSYATLVVKDGFPPPARVPLPIYLDFSTGGFTGFTFCGGCSPRVLEPAALQIEYRTLSPCQPSCGLPKSYPTLSSEIFHAIQFTQYEGPVPLGRWFSEGMAGWAGHEVNPDEPRWDPLYVAEWLGPNGTTDRAPEHRSFDAALIFAFLAEFYGGPNMMKALFAQVTGDSTADRLISDQLRTLGYRKTFTDVMAEFAGALASGNFTDKSLSRSVLALGPPISAAADWTGSSTNLTSFTDAANGFAAGESLRVRDAFGIEYVAIDPASNQSMVVKVQAGNQSCFRGSLVAHSAQGYSVHQFSASEKYVIESPGTYDRIYLAVIRGNCERGDFSVSLTPSMPIRPGDGSGEKRVAAVILVGVAIVIATIFVVVRPPSQRLQNASGHSNSTEAAGGIIKPAAAPCNSA